MGTVTMFMLANRTPTGDMRVELGLQGHAITEADPSTTISYAAFHRERS